ncbi:MAG: hypothetical protein IAE91_10585 [Ignavibacteriaceae bacterium]|nr:hypothetical protein [Ignavibacteriaceae bacterium]
MLPKYAVGIYLEGSDSKIAVFEVLKDGLKLMRAGSFEVTKYEAVASPDTISLEGELNLTGIQDSLPPAGFDEAYIRSLNALCLGLDYKKTVFIPVLTEPIVSFQRPDRGETQLFKKEVIEKIDLTDNSLEMADGGKLTIVPSNDTSYIDLVDRLAAANLQKNFKIPAVKTADTSLFYYVAKHFNFSISDFTLIFYTGKEYSRMIFLMGDQIKHIGPMLNLGKLNAGSYDVFASRILLEMENGEIPRLDNIVVCGEDTSAELIDTMKDYFPKTRISGIDFDYLDTSMLDRETEAEMSFFSVPICAVYEYIDELNKKYKGINLVPKSILERQKTFPLAWHGYIVLILIFGASFLATLDILDNINEIKILDSKIGVLKDKQRQNQDLLNQISEYEGKIRGFDETETILAEITADAGVYSEQLENMTTYIKLRRNLWILGMTVKEDSTTVLTGQSLSREILSNFTESIPGAVLNSLNSEKINDKTVYRFIMILPPKNREAGQSQ